MTAITAETQRVGSERSLHTGSLLMSFGALAFVGYAVIFFVLNFTDSFLELGIGREQVDVDKNQIQDFSPDLYHYISHLHIAVSGFIAATGIAALFLTWFGVRRGLLWAWAGAVAAPVVGLTVALPAHYPWGLATIGHLGLIYLATAIFIAGALLALKALTEKQSSPTNDRSDRS